jgi:hypothetical protein
MAPVSAGGNRSVLGSIDLHISAELRDFQLYWIADYDDADKYYFAD